jgi:hypothetical protein
MAKVRFPSPDGPWVGVQAKRSHASVPLDLTKAREKTESNIFDIEPCARAFRHDRACFLFGRNMGIELSWSNLGVWAELILTCEIARRRGQDQSKVPCRMTMATLK